MFQFSPDGRLASGSDDATVLVWDVEKILAGWRRPQVLQDAEVQALGAALAEADVLKANRAVWRLALAPEQAVPWLRKRLKPARPPQPRIQRLVRDLGSDEYQTREHATKALPGLGEKAEVALRAVLRESSDLEVRRRAARILKQVKETLAAARAARPGGAGAGRLSRGPQTASRIGRWLARGAVDPGGEGSGIAAVSTAIFCSLTGAGVMAVVFLRQSSWVRQRRREGGNR
jgi:hypothetical protein